MENHERRAAYASLWLVALAFGWIEASVVVYLRETFVREVSLHAPNYQAGLQVTLVSLPSHLVATEMVREACTILLLGAVAWLAGRRPADRAGAFLLSFGIWDLTYYAALKLIVGWPDSLSAWDILFLIPLPWVAPVWAPATIATLFVAAGSYLFWTPERERGYRWPDIGVLVASVLLTMATFLVESRAAIDHRVPEHFPVWLFGAGVVLGTAWFIRVERAVGRKDEMRSPWVAARNQAVSPERSDVLDSPSGKTSAGTATREASEEADIGRVIRDYTDAKRRLDRLLKEAGELGERFARLAQGLSTHPRRMIIGPEARPDDATEWDAVPSHPLPRIERLAALTNDIREAALKVDDLRERLILMGHANAVEQPDGFFQ